jgi:hypothetical protein
MDKITRRLFLRSSAVAGVAAAVATPVVAAETPKDRAARLWCEFSAAMDEVAEGTDGWVIVGAGNRFAHPWVRGGSFLNLRLVTYVREFADDPRFVKPFYVERHKQIDIDLGKAVSK